MAMSFSHSSLVLLLFTMQLATYNKSINFEPSTVSELKSAGFNAVYAYVVHIIVWLLFHTYV